MQEIDKKLSQHVNINWRNAISTVVCISQKVNQHVFPRVSIHAYFQECQSAHNSNVVILHIFLAISSTRISNNANPYFYGTNGPMPK
ncbi:hypothetical protein ACH3XW_24310 [Acanthocheilonema viteae]